MSSVRVTEGFSEVFDEEQLENVYCHALYVSTAVVEYLEKVIVYLTDNNIGNSYLSFNDAGIFLKTLKDNSEFSGAEAKINTTVDNYSKSTGYLTARMTAEALKQGKELLIRDEFREKSEILDWIWKGDAWQRQDEISKERVGNTGTRFLQSEKFESWASGKGSVSLLCTGIRIPTRV